MQQFLALITILSEAGGGSPPGIWGPTDPRPGWGLPPGGGGGGGGSPPGTWGGSGQPFPGYGLPGQPPGIWGPNDPRPGWGLPGGGGGSPGQPPGIWGPNDPRPGWGLPGGGGGGGQPPGTWGGSGEPFPGYGLPGGSAGGGGQPPGTWGPNSPGIAPPIYLPPGDVTEPPPAGGSDPKGWEIAWSPRYGYVWVSSSGKPQPIPTPPGHVEAPIQPTPTPKGR